MEPTELIPFHCLIYIVLITHFIADFILQSEWMANNKSKQMLPLVTHILVYTACLVVFSPLYALVNGVAHFFVDYTTSRLMAKAKDEGKIRKFFLILGVDQLAHQLCLIGTLPLSWFA